MADQEHEVNLQVKVTTFGTDKAALEVVKSVAKVLHRVFNDRVEIRYSPSESVSVVLDESIKGVELRHLDGQDVLVVGF